MVNQKKKTNYPLGWVKAQYRFAFALHTLTLLQHCSKYKILFLLDDAQQAALSECWWQMKCRVSHGWMYLWGPGF